MQFKTLYLKFILFALATPVIALTIFVLPKVLKNALANGSDWNWVIYSMIGIMYLSVIPFFLILILSFRLLRYYEQNITFSILSIHALQSIKNNASNIMGCYIAALPFFYLHAEIKDAPGFIIICLICILISATITQFTSILQSLLQEVMTYKTDKHIVKE